MSKLTSERSMRLFFFCVVAWLVLAVAAIASATGN